ncbi:uncharacterized protein VTP21DRAFT_2841 [Calcarisporiella thermophila]|uniref:uncharacterized protein n=1 Tax=Calcarisporiella thermophila TaxID=911321 RepID=UPI003743F78B
MTRLANKRSKSASNSNVVLPPLSSLTTERIHLLLNTIALLSPIPNMSLLSKDTMISRLYLLVGTAILGEMLIGVQVKGRELMLGYATLATIVGAVIIHVVTILFGAPVFNQILETWLFSLYLSSQTVLPAFLVLRTNVNAWFRVFIDFKAKTSVESAVLYSGLGACIGAWLSAITLPLDWDRPWQAWPIPAVVGTLLGCMSGHALYAVIDLGVQKKNE